MRKRGWGGELLSNGSWFLNGYEEEDAHDKLYGMKAFYLTFLLNNKISEKANKLSVGVGADITRLFPYHWKNPGVVQNKAITDLFESWDFEIKKYTAATVELYDSIFCVTVEICPPEEIQQYFSHLRTCLLGPFNALQPLNYGDITWRICM